MYGNSEESRGDCLCGCHFRMAKDSAYGRLKKEEMWSAGLSVWTP